MKIQLVEYILDCLWTGISHFLSWICAMIGVVSQFVSRCFQLMWVDFFVERLSFSTSPVLTSAIKRPKNWKDQSFLSRFCKGADRRLGCFSSSLSFLKTSPDLLCICEGERNLVLAFLMCEWQQRMDFESNSHTSTLNNWYFMNQCMTWKSSSSKLCVKLKCKPFKYYMYALVLHLYSGSMKDS